MNQLILAVLLQINGLKSVYNLNFIPIAEFGRRCNQLSDCLPQELIHVDPYVTLICAADYTAIGYEEAARELYEKAFAFYLIQLTQIFSSEYVFCRIYDKTSKMFQKPIAILGPVCYHTLQKQKTQKEINLDS